MRAGQLGGRAGDILLQGLQIGPLLISDVGHFGFVQERGALAHLVEIGKHPGDGGQTHFPARAQQAGKIGAAKVRRFMDFGEIGVIARHPGHFAVQRRFLKLPRPHQLAQGLQIRLGSMHGDR